MLASGFLFFFGLGPPGGASWWKGCSFRSFRLFTKRQSSRIEPWQKGGGVRFVIFCVGGEGVFKVLGLEFGAQGKGMAGRLSTPGLTKVLGFRALFAGLEGFRVQSLGLGLFKV